MNTLQTKTVPQDCEPKTVSANFALMGLDHQPDRPEADEGEFVASIGPDVISTLAARGFFAELDDRLCPVDGSDAREHCGGDHEISTSILRSRGFDDIDIAEVLAVLRSQGGFCDCEILYNVVDTSRLKAA
jgi:hypothetical protein